MPTTQNWTRFRTILSFLETRGLIKGKRYRLHRRSREYGPVKIVLTEKGEKALDAFNVLISLGLDIINEDV